MYKSGDKFEVVSGGGCYGLKVGDILTFHEEISSCGAWFKTELGKLIVGGYDEKNALTTTVRPLRTEAEKRGAKFGVGGVEKDTGKRVVFNAVRGCPHMFTGEEVWVVIREDIPDSVTGVDASNIRLDHEPEYKEIPFSEATHEQRMDAGNLIIDGGLGVSEIMKFDMAGYVYTLRGSTKVYTDTTILTVRIPHMTAPNLLQTQFLKRHITMEPQPIPVCGPFLSVSVQSQWFTHDENNCLTITPSGIKAFWSGVKHHGIHKVMSQPNMTGPTNTPPSGGSPVAIAA